MKKFLTEKYARVLSMVAASGTVMQFGGCLDGDFLIDFAGVGAIVAGLSVLFT